MSLGSLGPFLRTFRRSRCLVATCTSAKLEITCPALLKCIPCGNPSFWPRKVMQMAPPTASRKLSTEELSMCKPLEGKETTLSEEYPPDMVSEILKGIKMTAREDDPERFAKKRFNALPVQLEQDLNKWTDVFKLVEEHFQRSSHRSRVLASNGPLWRLIKPLVPWHKIERVQIASQQQHWDCLSWLGHSLQHGEIEVNSEDLSDVRHPRGRFRKPVNFAIFLLGQADASSDWTPPRPDSLQQPPSSFWLNLGDLQTWFSVWRFQLDSVCTTNFCLSWQGVPKLTPKEDAKICNFHRFCINFGTVLKTWKWIRMVEEVSLEPEAPLVWSNLRANLMEMNFECCPLILFYSHPGEMKCCKVQS